MIDPFILVAVFVAGLILIPLAGYLAVKYHYVDQPDERKQHETPIPPIGGLVIIPLFMVGMILSGYGLSDYWPLYSALTIVLITGAIDDKKELNAKFKFLIQTIAAVLIVVPGGATVTSLGNILGFGDLPLGWMALPFSLFCTVLLVNSINLMDGLDGLAGGKSFVILIWFVIAAYIGGAILYFPVILMLMAALGAFLMYNLRHPFRKQASIFLGDAGSLCLGLILAWLGIQMAQGTDAVMDPMALAWIIALPVMDSCGQFIRRIREGRHPFDPDRGHFHHHFVHAGIPVGQSTTMILMLGFVLGGIGYLGIAFGVPPVVLFVGWVALLFSHVYLSQKPEKYVRALARFSRL